MKLATNSAWSLAGALAPTAVALVTLPLFIGTIGAERYGVLAIAWLLLGYFGAADFGLGRAVAQRTASLAAAGRGALAAIVWSGLGAMAGLGLFGAALLYGAARWYFGAAMELDAGLRAEVLAAVWLLALCNPLVALGGVLTGALTGLERFREVALAQMSGNVLVMLLPLAAALAGRPELTALIAASLAGRLIGLLPLAVALWRTLLSGTRPQVSGEELRLLSRYGAWIMVSSIVSPLMVLADRFVIGAMIGAAAVAAYVIPYQIATRAQILPMALVNALFPRFAAEDGTAARRRCRDFTVLVGLMFAPVSIALIALAGPLLSLWLGEALDPRSVPVAQWLLAGLWTNAVANVPYGFIQARGDPRFTALLHLAELPFYAAALIALGGLFGLTGYAAAFALRCLADGLMLCRRAGVLDPRATASLALPAVLVLATLLVAGQLAEPAALIALALAGVALALVLVAVLVPQPLRQPLRQLAQRWV